jgi:ubiquitin carboxyl-terminal hydrolase 48
MTQENRPHRSEESAHPHQATYSSHRTFGTRQSKRIRESKDTVEKRRITVSKSTTVKDIKVMVSALSLTVIVT